MSIRYSLEQESPFVETLNQNINAIIVHGGIEGSDILFLVLKRWQQITFKGNELAYVNGLLLAIDEAKNEYEKAHKTSDGTDLIFTSLTSCVSALRVVTSTNRQIAALQHDEESFAVSTRFTSLLPESPIKLFLGRMIKLQENTLTKEAESVLDAVIKREWQHINYQGNKNTYIDLLLMAVERTQSKFELRKDYYCCYHDTFSALKLILKSQADSPDADTIWDGWD